MIWAANGNAYVSRSVVRCCGRFRRSIGDAASRLRPGGHRSRRRGPRGKAPDLGRRVQCHEWESSRRHFSGVLLQTSHHFAPGRFYSGRYLLSLRQVGAFYYFFANKSIPGMLDLTSICRCCVTWLTAVRLLSGRRPACTIRRFRAIVTCSYCFSEMKPSCRRTFGLECVVWCFSF